MENENLFTPSEIQNGSYRFSLGVHHGKPETGKPVFLLVQVWYKDHKITDFDPFDSGFGTLFIQPSSDPGTEKYTLESTTDGLMKKITFSEVGTYTINIKFSHHSKVQEAEFTVEVSDGDHRDSPVG